jgi:hypothetical protein
MIGILPEIETPRSDREFLSAWVSDLHWAFRNDLTLTCIPSSMEQCGPGCFYGCPSLSNVTVESASKRLGIGGLPFWNWSSLSPICILASVKTLGRECFSGCRSLSTVAFESASKLSSIEPRVFLSCWSLLSISIPSSTRKMQNPQDSFIVPADLRDTAASTPGIS